MFEAKLDMGTVRHSQYFDLNCNAFFCDQMDQFLETRQRLAWQQQVTKQDSQRKLVIAREQRELVPEIARESLRGGMDLFRQINQLLIITKQAEKA